MKNKLVLGFLVLLTISLSIVSCKKDSKEEEDTSAESQQLASDENSMQVESEGLLNDINTVVESSPLGKVYNISGATVNDSSFIASKKIVITFNGNNADGTRSRTGSATLQLIAGSKWTDMGATLQITYDSVIITRKVNQKTVRFDGTFYVRNVTGGKVFVASNVVHKFWGNGSLLFDKDGTSKTWNINRKRTFTVNGSIFNIKTESDTIVDGISNVITWGTNRKGNGFYTLVNQPIIISSACPAGPISGEKVHKGLTKEITVVFGVDYNGVVVTSGCPYGFNVKWTNKKNEAKNAVFAY